MPYTTTYDPATLDYVVAAQHQARRRQPNPYPRLTVPPASRVRRTVRAPQPPEPAADDAARTWPLYAVRVPIGREAAVAHKWVRRVGGIRVLLPVFPRTHEPRMPGVVFLAMPPDQVGAIAELAALWAERGLGFGRLDRVPLPDDFRDTIWQWATPEKLSPTASRPLWAEPDHPLYQFALVVGHHRGWHGHWTPTGWIRHRPDGTPVTDPQWDAWWADWLQTWEAGASLPAVLTAHRTALTGVVFPVHVEETPPTRDWRIRWYGLEGHIPAAEHAGVHLRPGSRTIWATLTDPDPLTFSLVTPALPVALVGYRIPVRDWVRQAGQETVFLTQGPVTEAVHRQVRDASRLSGLAEPWSVVSVTDPIGIVRRLLRPTRWQVDRQTGVLSVAGVAKARRRWIGTVTQWTGWAVIVRD